MSSPKPTYNHWFDRWVFTSFTMGADALGLYRILYALFLLVWGLPNFSWMANTPNGFFNPPTYSLANLFSGFPPAWFLQGLSLCVALLCLLLLFGWRTRVVSIALFVAIVVGKSFAFSFGLIGQDLIVWLVPLVMSFSQWGNSFSIDSNRQAHAQAPTNAWPVTLMCLLLGFGMFSAGVPKLLGGWLSLDTQATRGHLFTQYYVIGQLKLLASWMVTVINPLLWEFMDWAAVWFELLFLIALFKARWFRALLLVAVVFHTGTFLVFNISFHFQYIVYLLFIDWEKVSPAFYNKLQILAQRWFTYKGLLLAIGVYMPLYFLSQQVVAQPGLLAPSPFIMLSDRLGFDYKIVVGVTALSAAYAITLWQLLAKPKTIAS